MSRKINLTIELLDDWEDYLGCSDEEIMEIIIETPCDIHSMDIKIEE
jgi:hypothetical protein